MIEILLKKLVDVVYKPSKNIIPSKFDPSTGGKKKFIEEFIQKTLAYDSNTPILSIAKYYVNLFQPGVADGQKLLDLRKKWDEDFKEMEAEIEQEQKDALDEYNTKQQKLQSKKPQLNKAPIAKSLDEQMRDSDGVFRPEVVGTKFALPKSKGKRPVQDLSETTTAQRNVIDDPTNEGKNSGVAGDRLVEAGGIPTLLYPGDREVRGENNAGLLMTRDFFYGEKGHTNAGACFLYAGKNPPGKAGGESIIRQIAQDLVNPLGLEQKRDPQAKRRPDVLSDSAYLYLSQKSDSDSLLKVAGGTYAKRAGDRTGESLAAMKADGVVLIARESGIRLITGTDESNSKGGDLTSKFGIDLIAGNNDEDLEPLVKGESLHTYLKNLSKSVDELAGVTYDFLFAQMSLNTKVAFHTHYDPSYAYVRVWNWKSRWSARWKKFVFSGAS